jgi:hypothetical protein
MPLAGIHVYIEGLTISASPFIFVNIVLLKACRQSFTQGVIKKIPKSQNFFQIPLLLIP